MDQTPAGGQQVDEGSTVTLFVSNGKLKEVPDVTGLDQAEAEADLRSAGFHPERQARQRPTEPDRGRDRAVPDAHRRQGSRQRGATVVITVGSSPRRAGATPAPGGAR